MRLVFFILIAGMLTGCAPGEESALPVTPEALQHHRFVLVEADGQSVPADKMRPLELSVGEKMYVYGTLCGQFSGHGTLHQNRLQVPALQTTQARCRDPELQRLDGILNAMLQQGVKLNLRGQQLTLSAPPHRLVYRLEDLVG